MITDGGDNSNDGGSVDGNGIFEKCCVNRKVVMRLMMMMNILRVLQEPLLNVIEVPKRK